MTRRQATTIRNKLYALKSKFKPKNKKQFDLGLLDLLPEDIRGSKK